MNSQSPDVRSMQSALDHVESELPDRCKFPDVSSMSESDQHDFFSRIVIQDPQGYDKIYSDARVGDCVPRALSYLMKTDFEETVDDLHAFTGVKPLHGVETVYSIAFAGSRGYEIFQPWHEEFGSNPYVANLLVDQHFDNGDFTVLSSPKIEDIKDLSNVSGHAIYISDGKAYDTHAEWIDFTATWIIADFLTSTLMKFRLKDDGYTIIPVNGADKAIDIIRSDPSWDFFVDNTATFETGCFEEGDSMFHGVDLYQRNVDRITTYQNFLKSEYACKEFRQRKLKEWKLEKRLELIQERMNSRITK